MHFILCYAYAHITHKMTQDRGSNAWSRPSPLKGLVFISSTPIGGCLKEYNLGLLHERLEDVRRLRVHNPPCCKASNTLNMLISPYSPPSQALCTHAGCKNYKDEGIQGGNGVIKKILVLTHN